MLSFINKLFNREQINYADLLERGATIIDVRTPAEFAQGHITKAINIPLSEINGRINQLKKQGKPIITCCRSGARSGSAAGILKGAGLEVYNGGAWDSLQRAIN